MTSISSDEFYTQHKDIEKEIPNYAKYFENKVVYCNCDEYGYSQFVKYFKDNFEKYKLKKLISTYFVGQDKEGASRYIFDRSGEILEGLEGDGDFRSQGCIKSLKQSDIIITNPPFSLFREYIGQLMEHNKKFIIIGPKIGIVDKDIFPLLKSNKMWVGWTSMNVNMLSDTTKEYAEYLIKNKKEGSAYKIVDNTVKIRSGCMWFTNIKHQKRNKKLSLHKEYSMKEYPKYDNYDAINVNFVKDIPKDYDGVMGVPISFMDKYNPEQFEILGKMPDKLNKIPTSKINGKNKYARILIKYKR